MRTFLRDTFARVAARLLPSTVMRDKRYFELWQARGYHVTPVHFYEPIPDTRTLGDETWATRSSAPGVRLDADAYDALLRALAAETEGEWPLPHVRTDNGSFETTDAFVAYGLVRRHRPRRIVEIGSGWSSRVIDAALTRNDVPCDYRIVDPYPSPLVADLGYAEIVPLPAQAAPPAFFHELAENDVLFVDSSHVVALGSDVQRIVLEILPRLRSGVLVHFHDVFIPDEYPRSWAKHDRWFWTEQYIVQAFLACNDAFEIVWAGHYMFATRPDALRRAFGSAVDAGSLWIRRR